MHRYFAATGRFAVRFRWAIVAAWVAATVLATLVFPSLTSVAKQNNTDLLPAGSPSLHAARLATPFLGPDQTPVSVVLVRANGPVTATDTTAIGRLTARLATVTDVQQVKDLGDSPDHQAVQLEVLAGLNLATPGPAQRLVAGLRDAIAASALPGGLRTHLAGPVAAQADASQAGQKAVNLGQDLSIVFIVVLLLVVFGSLLAPLLTRALERTGSTVTSAGLVLAGTFGVFALVVARLPGGGVYTSVLASLAIGILLDAFVVRTLLVPCTVALLGRWNWWPSTHGTPAQAALAPEPEPAPAHCR